MDKTTNPPATPSFIEQFHAHPASVGETYWGHLAFAFKFGAMLIGAGFAALIHGLIPPLFTTTGSDLIKRMHADLIARQK